MATFAFRGPRVAWTEASEPKDEDHTCVLINVPSLLFDAQWLGADGVTIQVGRPAQDSQLVLQGFRTAFEQSVIKGDAELVGDGRIRITNARTEKQSEDEKVDPQPFMKLVPLCLWVEPNKLSKLSPEERLAIASNAADITAALTQEVAQCGQDLLVVEALFKMYPAIGEGEASLGVRVRDQVAERQKAMLSLTGVVTELTAVSRCTLCQRVTTIETRVGSSMDPKVVEAALEDAIARRAAVPSVEKSKKKRMQQQIKHLRDKLLYCQQQQQEQQ